MTRPEPDGARSAERLAALGHGVMTAPMMTLAFTADAVVPTAGVQAIAATSANGVRALRANSHWPDLKEIALFTVGDATARAAAEAGFSAIFSAKGRVGELAELIQARLAPADGAILYAAGADRTGDLEGRLARAGFECRLQVVYRAEAVARLDATTAAAILAGTLEGVLFYSKRTAELFMAAAGRTGCGAAALRLRVFCLSESVGEACRAAGFAAVVVAERPEEDHLFAAIGPA